MTSRTGETFGDRLHRLTREKGSRLCVGLDPDLARIPDSIRRAALEDASDPAEGAATAIERFGRTVIEAVAPFAVAVKLQIAFYERWLSPGLRAFERNARDARDRGLLVIADVKRGDIGSTAEAYAAAHLDPSPGIDADAVTVNPLLGLDGVEPFLARCRQRGKGVFVLVRTSNPSARDLQDLDCDGEPLFLKIADLVARWGEGIRGHSGWSSVGAVAGATYPDELRRIRSEMPWTPLLVPGIGAQGASIRDACGAFDTQGMGALLSSSRAILYPPGDGSIDAIADAAHRTRDEIEAACRLGR
ncbi:MAG: orotidine-5'-phosphate decarboxylase [Planctomycetes bacterium]|nr:orotidine-5'-phosphate decarboxylase [Planctomycetota bacterium]MBI3848267.1 orotidine-5'-phosphate decarboxylase [Planctomycetota bacterium]